MTKDDTPPKKRGWKDYVEDSGDDLDSTDPHIISFGDSLRDTTNKNRPNRTGKYTKKFR